MSVGFQSKKIASYAAFLAAMLAAFAAGAAKAADDIVEPAGDLPPKGSDADDPQAAPADTSGAEQVSAGKDAGDETNAAADKVPTEAWDSYGGAPSVAQEVTKGVRVEDIVEPPSDYRYAAFGKSDPFLPPMVTEESVGGPGPVDPLEIPIVSPLQRFSLNELTVIGIWQLNTGERKAMIMAPSARSGAGQGIIVKIGDPVGNRGGKILGVGDDYVTVREFSLAADGTRRYEDQQLYMGKRNPEDLSGKIVFRPGVTTTTTVNEKNGISVGEAGDDAAADSPAALQPAKAGGRGAAMKPQGPSGVQLFDPGSLLQNAAGSGGQGGTAPAGLPGDRAALAPASNVVPAGIPAQPPSGAAATGAAPSQKSHKY